MGWGEEAEESRADLEHHGTVRATYMVDSGSGLETRDFGRGYPMRSFWVGARVPLVYSMGRRAIEADRVAFSFFLCGLDELDLRGVEVGG